MSEPVEDNGTPALPTPAVATPAHAPATPAADPAKEPPKPADTPKDGEPSGAIEYEPIEGDPGLTMALQFIGKHGIGPDSPEVQAALKGDFSFLKASLAAKGAAGSDHFVALAEKSWEKHVEESAATATKTAEAIHSAVGGKESWEAIQKWAGENADEGEKKVINGMLNAGGFQARAAALLLQQMHASAAGTTVNPANPVAGAQPSQAAAPTGAALSPEAYAKEVAALVNKLGTYGAGRSPEMEALRQRRSQYRG